MSMTVLNTDKPLTNLFHTVNDNQGNEIIVVYLKDLKVHPLNEELYPKAEYAHNITELAKYLKEHENETGVPNHQPIVVCKYTGIIYSGNTRYYAALENGQTFLYATVSSTRYDPSTSKFVEIKTLEKYNLDGKRNESDLYTAARAYTVNNEAYFEEFGKNIPPKMKKQFAFDRRIDINSLNKALNIYARDKELLKKVSAGEITLQNAYRKVMQKQPEYKPDPNRFNFYDYMEKKPEIKKQIMNLAMNWTKQTVEINYGGINPILDSQFGIEQNHFTGMISNFFMSATAKSFNDSGIYSRTPRHHMGHPDVQFPDLCKEGFEKEFIEVKAAQYGDTCAQTYFYGGKGNVEINEHDFLLVVYDANAKKIFAMLTELSKDDWKTDSGAFTLTLSSWFKKYFNDPSKYTFIAGDIYEGQKGKPQITFANSSDFL